MFPLFFSDSKRRNRFLMCFCALSLALLITIGVFARNGWFPATDSLVRNASSSWNPFTAPPSPTPTPALQKSKEYVYAGSRLLAVEDANASAVPPSDLAI